jgi:hypothetical protein
MDIETVKAEIKRAKDALAKATVIDPKQELEKNILPLMELQIELLVDYEDRLAETEDIVASVLAGAESILQPAVATRIVALIVAGLRINEEISKLDEQLIGPELRGAITGYGMLAKDVLEEIQAITVDGPAPEATPITEGKPA